MKNYLKNKQTKRINKLTTSKISLTANLITSKESASKTMLMNKRVIKNLKIKRRKMR